MVRTFEEDTGLPLNLENFLLEYNMSLYDFYQNTGARSLFRLKKWAGIIEDDRDVDDKIYSMIFPCELSQTTGLLDQIY